MIKVFDNFLEQNDIETLHKVLWDSDWYLQGTDYPMSDLNQRGWAFIKYMNLDEEKQPIYKKILSKIQNLPELENMVCSRVLRNAYKFSDVIGLHRDTGYDITALVFGNKEWKLNWGSETIFTNEETEDAEIIQSVIPKPGRLLIFDSDIPHTGRVPSSSFPHYRYSLVFNFKKTI